MEIFVVYYDVLIRVAGLTVPGCEGPSTMVKSPTCMYTLFCREISYVVSYARDQGGVAKK